MQVSLPCADFLRRGLLCSVSSRGRGSGLHIDPWTNDRHASQRRVWPELLRSLGFLLFDPFGCSPRPRRSHLFSPFTPPHADRSPLARSPSMLFCARSIAPASTAIRTPVRFIGMRVSRTCFDIAAPSVPKATRFRRDNVTVSRRGPARGVSIWNGDLTRHH
jgi:hypothetical protein